MTKYHGERPHDLLEELTQWEYLAKHGGQKSPVSEELKQGCLQFTYPATPERLGFNIGPEYFRQYGKVCDRIQGGVDWAGARRLFEVRVKA